MWKEIVAPLLALEFVSGDGTEERDDTSPLTSDGVKAGKFWVYEQAVHIPFYGIYEVDKAAVELYQLVGGRYQRCLPNERGHDSIPPMGMELGIWEGEYMHQLLPWLRWWDSAGNLLLSGDERAVLEDQRADQERQRADRLAAKLRDLGIDPES